MIDVFIPATEIDVLQEERYMHPHSRVQRKLHALYLVGLGYPRHDVARVVGVSEGAVRNYLHPMPQGPGGTSILRRRGCAVMDRATILHDYIAKIVAARQPEAIVLFRLEVGYMVTDDSDFDFLIIEHTMDPTRKRDIKYQMALRPCVIAVGILVRTPEELHQTVVEGHPVIRQILRTGRWMYGERRAFGTARD